MYTFLKMHKETFKFYKNAFIKLIAFFTFDLDMMKYVYVKAIKINISENKLGDTLSKQEKTLNFLYLNFFSSHS